MTDKQKEKYPDQCHECQIKDGAKPPKHGLTGVTCVHGVCPGCGVEGILMYACDYDWPGGRKAVND